MKYTRLVIVIAMICASIFVDPNAYANQIGGRLKSRLIKGYMVTCVPTLAKQAPWIGRVKIEAYCLCVGEKTFQNFTQQQYEFLVENSRLPPEIEAKRNAFRNKCDAKLD
jgi:hypothetical protein